MAVTLALTAATAAASANLVGLTMTPARFSGGASVVGPLGTEVVAVRAATAPRDPGGLQDDVAPRHHHGDDDDEDDDRDDDPERRAVEHSQTLAGAEGSASGQ